MNQLYTPWGEKIDKDNVLPEYPRPQLRRDSYLSLNGFWDYGINGNGAMDSIQEKILVPFSPEAALSGVNRFVSPDEFLIYRRKVVLPEGFNHGRLILHFGAVDQEAEVFIDNRSVGTHLGGFTAFSFDITDHVEKTEFTIGVVVKDLTDTADRQTGKQRIKRGGIFYTPQSGIWQSVWLESVPEEHVRSFRLFADFDNRKLEIFFDTGGDTKSLPIGVRAFYQGKPVASAKTKSSHVVLDIKEWHPWTPEKPDLYDLEIEYGEDRIKSYFGMRKFERKPDDFGIMRFYLNNKPYFLSGVLDQGYYPDGLLTPPADEAMENDIRLMKKMGFNFIRKHIKIEPMRWYYHCDRLGIIVWQDMVSGWEANTMVKNTVLALLGVHFKDTRYAHFGRLGQVGRDQFEVEMNETLAQLQNVVSISTWVPFNEAWGQFDSLRIERKVREEDPTRLVDHASGWSDQKGGDYCSRHIYFRKIRFHKKDGKKRILALTEFGGYSLLLPEHSFNPDKVYGYRKYSDEDALGIAVNDLYMNQVIPEIKKGLSVLVYTQLSDVEDEVNGFVTYDRKVEKIKPEEMRDINKHLFNSFKNSLKNR